MTEKVDLHPCQRQLFIGIIVAHWKKIHGEKQVPSGQMSNFGYCIRARWYVKVIHFFWHLPSKMLQISIVISFSQPVWDYRLNSRVCARACVCVCVIKYLTFKLVQLLLVQCREWCSLPAPIQLSPLLSGGGLKTHTHAHTYIYHQ